MDCSINVEEVPSVTTDSILALMGCPQFIEHIKGSGITPADLLSLQLPFVNLLLPAPTFGLADRYDFVQKYCSFMTVNNLALHDSFSGQIQTSNHACDVASKQTSDGATMQKSDESSMLISDEASKQTVDEPSNQTSEVGSSKRAIHFDDPLSSDSDNYVPNSEDGDSSSSDVPLSSLRNKCVKRNPSSSKPGPLPRISVQTISVQSSTPASSENEDVSSKPLVDKSVIGASRRATNETKRAIDELDLKKLFHEYPSSAAVLIHYKKIKILTDSDRSTLTDVLIEWLLKRTEFPKQEHYLGLWEKIAVLFPSEKQRSWYLPPFAESDKQKYGKGRLYDKVRNCKTKLRKKGFLQPSNPKKKQRDEAKPQIVLSPEERAAQAWLLRNQEPFEDVQIYWKRCALSRLKELLFNLTPSAYIEKWMGIIKMPKAFRLILDDFEVLPDVDPTYQCLRGKGSSMFDKWPEFVECVIQIIANDEISGLSRAEKKRFQSFLQNAPNENVKDYIILQTLPYLCKQKGRVQFGKKYVKPTAEESKDSFILFVPGAGEFDNCLRERQKRHRKAGASVSPYVVVLGPPKEAAPDSDASDTEEESTFSISDVNVTSAYVIINEVPWKMGSVQSAVDVCFKFYYCIHTNYPPESYHLWQLVQQYLYDIRLTETVYSCVTDFISKLEYVSNSQ